MFDSDFFDGGRYFFFGLLPILFEVRSQDGHGLEFDSFCFFLYRLDEILSQKFSLLGLFVYLLVSLSFDVVGLFSNQISILFDIFSYESHFFI